MVLTVVLILASLQILIKVDFIPLSPEEIEKIELEELKAQKAMKDRQKMERQAQ